MENEIYTEVVIGLYVDKRKLVELGEPVIVSDTILTPVRFSDGQFGIVTSGDRYPDLFLIDSTPIAAAITESIRMPVLSYVSGEYWFLVKGCDVFGKYVAQINFGPSSSQTPDQLARTN